MKLAFEENFKNTENLQTFLHGRKLEWGKKKKPQTKNVNQIISTLRQP